MLASGHSFTYCSGILGPGTESNEKPHYYLALCWIKVYFLNTESKLLKKYIVSVAQYIGFRSQLHSSGILGPGTESNKKPTVLDLGTIYCCLIRQWGRATNYGSSSQNLIDKAMEHNITKRIHLW